MQNNRIIFVGHFGSGKTEIAIDTALAMKKSGDAVALVDLDIVNPYFRSAERQGLLKAAGVTVFMPTFAMTAVDVPALPAEIQAALELKSTVIIDVGGDDLGARALGRYYPWLSRTPYEMNVVVNPFRPLSDNAESICALIARIESVSRLRLTALISNPNLGDETTLTDLLEGHKIVESVARAQTLPIIALYAQSRLINSLPAPLQKIARPLTRRMKPEWME